MRVAFGHYCSSDDISGVSSWLLRLATHLRQGGHEVAVHLFDLTKSGESPPWLEVELRLAGVEVAKAPPSGDLDRDVQTTLHFLNEWRPDLFLPQCKSHHYVAAAIAGQAGLHWVLTLHSDDPDYWAVVESLPPQNHGGSIACVSQAIHAKLSAYPSRPEAVQIPYGIPIPDKTASHQANPFRVVYSGRLWEHQKRISLVIQSLIKACAQPGADLVATVIGDGYCRESSQQMVLAAGLGDRISFVGRQHVSAVYEILQNSQAILLMSDFEGLPVALLEGMAAGLVPVARAIPSGIPELVRNRTTGLLVGDSAEEAAAAMVELAGNPELWQSCSKQARELVANTYSEEVSNSKWLQFLSHCTQLSTVTYPISQSNSINLAKLSPLMKAPYHRASAWQFLHLRSRYNTATARLKAWLKHKLGRGF